MSPADEAVAVDTAAEAVQRYAQEHPTEQMALPELVDAIAEQAHTTVHVAKRAIFLLMDRGDAQLTPEFKVKFASGS
jgi:hypothetical protein